MLSVVVIEADGLEAKDVNGKWILLHSELRLSSELQAVENTDFLAKLSFPTANNETIFHD